MLIRRIGLIVMVLVAYAPLVALAGAHALPDYAWRYRPLIVVAPVGDDVRLREQAFALNAEKTAMLDRNIVLIEIIGDEVNTRHGPRLRQDADTLRKQLGIGPDQFSVVLIGKDTNVKLRSQSPVDSGKIFSLIDSMPMRQHEMRAQSEVPAKTGD